MNTRTRAFSSTPEAASEASRFIQEAAEALELPEPFREQLLLAVGEAVSNAARHGNAFDPEKRVTVMCCSESEEIRLCVEDEGEGVPSERLDQAALPADPLETSGRGLFIMKTLADRIWLEEQGRRLCMTWRLDGV